MDWRWFSPPLTIRFLERDLEVETRGLKTSPSLHYVANRDALAKDQRWMCEQREQLKNATVSRTTSCAASFHASLVRSACIGLHLPTSNCISDCIYLRLFANAFMCLFECISPCFVSFSDFVGYSLIADSSNSRFVSHKPADGCGATELSTHSRLALKKNSVINL